MADEHAEPQEADAVSTSDLIDQKLQDFVRLQLAPALNDMRSQLKEELVSSFPSADAFAAAVHERLEARSENHAEELRDGLEEAGAEELDGHDHDSNRNRDLNVVQMIEFAVEKFIQFKQMETQMSDPFAWAARLSEAEPAKAHFIGAMLNPDPLAAKLPEIQSHTAIRSFDSGMKVALELARQGWNVTPPQGSSTPTERPSQTPSETPTAPSPKPGEGSLGEPDGSAEMGEPGRGGIRKASGTASGGFRSLIR